MKNKGFTLIELIAVVVIMGIILLMVFPAVSNLIRSNENKKYDTYYEAVQEQVELYARTRRSELGGIQGSGCVDDKTLSNLKVYDYITEFKDEKNIDCMSPADFSPEDLMLFNVDTSKQYVNVQIENNKGRIKVEYSMICARYEMHENVKEYNKMVYSNLVEKTKTCENYTPTESNSLLNTIKNNLVVTTVDYDNYVVGNSLNNYVWYSGKLWRITGFNTNDRTIKLVTDDNISLLTYNANNNDYSSSNIYTWLNEIFIKTLRNPEKYLATSEWNFSAVDYDANTKITGGSFIISKVGLLNNFEYNVATDGLGNNYLNIGKNFWLLSTVGFNNAWYVNSSNSISASIVYEFYGVRPSIVLKPNVTYVTGGNGTKSNPYRLTGDTSAPENTLLNTRFAGEYVSFEDNLYRISSVDAKYTKLVLDRTLNVEKDFHYFDTTYSNNTYIGEYLLTWINGMEDYLVEGDYCKMQITKQDYQTTSCPNADIINLEVAIPKIGDMFTVESTKEYWTLTNADELRTPVLQSDGTYKDDLTARLYSVLTSGAVKEKKIEEKAYIKPVLTISNEALIASGDGTSTNPYTITINTTP